MALSKSLMVARTDLKIALKLKWVRYSLAFMGALGPIFVILLVGGINAFAPPGEEMPATVASIMVSMGSALLTVMSVIPAGLIAANALVGERESKTLEPLLCTPLTDRELILGKTLSSLLPCLAILFGGTLASAIGVNIIMIVTGNNLVLFPDLPGMFLIFAAGPVVILAVVSTMILVSGKVSRVYEAYQTGSVASLVLFIPIFGPFALIESTEPNPSFILLVNMVTFLIATVLASVTWTLALKRFNRDTMVSLV